MAMREDLLYEVFLNLQNAYDSLDRERCMDIIVGYGFGPRTERILQNYWDHLSMVARAGRYHGKSSKGHQGVTQGDPLYHTIFNMMVDVVIYHWFALVTREEARPKALVGLYNR